MPDGALSGARVALFEARLGSELAELVRRRGGEPTCVAAVKEVPADDAASQVASFIDTHRTGLVIFLTGAGATGLLNGAAQLGRLPELVESLSRSHIVCRGPKPSAVLRTFGLSSDIYVAEPYTSKELLESLEQIDLTDVPVAIVHYGERNAALTDVLTRRCLALSELCLYEWQLPEDTRPLEHMILRIVGDEFDAVAFTSQIQCRHLLQVAARMQLDHRLIEALNERTVVAAIGPTCRDAALALGVRSDIVPQPPKMGALVAALAEYLARA